jgi:hypothetical protein
MLQGQCTCVLEALQSNNQCVYCRKVLDPQDIINCTTLLRLKIPPEVNISQTTTLLELKATPEANFSQTEIAANMNLQNVLGEAPVQDEDMNLWEEPVQNVESSVSSILTFTKKNGLYAPIVLMRMSISPCLKKYVPTHRRMYALIALESKLLFLWV